jgi:hypothetical protein
MEAERKMKGSARLVSEVLKRHKMTEGGEFY